MTGWIALKDYEGLFNPVGQNNNNSKTKRNKRISCLNV